MSCQHRIFDHKAVRFSLLFAVEISFCHSVDFWSWKLDPGHAVFLWHCQVTSSALNIPSPSRSLREFLKYSAPQRCDRHNGSRFPSVLQRRERSYSSPWSISPHLQRIHSSCSERLPASRTDSTSRCSFSFTLCLNFCSCGFF